MPKPVAVEAVPIRIITQSAPKKPRVAVPIKAEAQNQPVLTKGVGFWQIYPFKDNSGSALIQVVHNNKRTFSVIFQSKEGWLFWSGPKKKVFTPPGRGEIWTTQDVKIAVIVANFIHSSRLPDVPKPEKPKRR